MRTNYILDVLSTEYAKQAITDSSRSFNVFEQLCMMTMMRGSSMSKTEYDLKSFMYPIYVPMAHIIDCAVSVKIKLN